ETMFSLNIGYAFGYALSLYISKNQLLWTPKSAWGYYLSRSAVRINDFLGFKSTPATSTNLVARVDYPVHQLGVELAFLISVAGLAGLAFLVLWMRIRDSGSQALTSRLTGVTVMFVVPSC